MYYFLFFNFCRYFCIFFFCRTFSLFFELKKFFFFFLKTGFFKKHKSLFFFDYFLKFFFLKKFFYFNFYLKLGFLKLKCLFSFFWEKLFFHYKIFLKHQLKTFKYFIFNFLSCINHVFINCDSSFFINFLKSEFCNIHFKNQKNFIVILKNVCFYYYKYFAVYIGVFGYFFKINGKLSLTGISKTKSTKFFCGNFSYLNNSFLISLSKCYIKSFSGVLGYFFIIFF